jgi:amino acid adenylation domain-containing protein
MEKIDSQTNPAISLIDKNTEEGYLINTLGENFSKSCLPYDYLNYSARDYSLKELTFEVNQNAVADLNKLCNNSEVKLHFFLSTVMFILINKYTNESNVTFGTPIYKQKSDGKFINTKVILNNVIDEELSFKAFLIKTKDNIIEAFRHQNYPVDNLIRKLKLPYGKDDFYPLFDVVLILDNIQKREYIDDIKCNLYFSFFSAKETLNCKIEYNSNLYKDSSIINIFQVLNQILVSSLQYIDMPLKDIEFIPESQKKILLHEFNGAKYKKVEKTVIDEFREKAHAKPDKIAIDFEGNKITFGELDRKSDVLAGLLIQQDSRSKVVAIHLNPSIDLVLAMLGVLKAGGVFLPIDPGIPKDRKNYFLADSNVHRIISNNADDFDYLFKDKIISLNTDCLIEYEPISSIEIKLSDYAYIIYTSGTTGRPKGTIISHKGLANYIYWSVDTYIQTDEITFPLFTSVSFDLTLTSIFTPLVSANTIHIYNIKEPSELLKSILLDNKIEIIKLTPTHIKIINGIKEELSSIKYKSRLRKVIVGGEQINGQDINDLKCLLGDLLIYNEYGPTETVVGSTVYEDLTWDKHENISVGKPISNTCIYILDSNKKIVPIGGIGEIYIGGHGVANGYLNKPELTKDKFVNDLKYTQETLYRTGDLARWRNDGNIDFLGRTDDQIKIRGYRIELKEIENQLSKHQSINEVAVISINKKGDIQIVAYYTSHIDFKMSDLRFFLSDKLPDYMIPAFFIKLSSIPLTLNGKLDTKALPQPEILNDEYVGPSGDLEEKLLSIWAKVLGVDKNKLSVTSNFFELGGHSLKVMEAVNIINSELKIKMTLKDFFSKYTIRMQAELIEMNNWLLNDSVCSGNKITI